MFGAARTILLSGTAGFSRAYSAIDAGFKPNIDLGTDGDWFVAPDGNDLNNGKTRQTAYRNVATGVASLQPGQTLRIAGNNFIYPENINLTNKGGLSSSALTRVLGWGTDKPIISAADKFTGWTLCTVGNDASVLGNALAASGKVWKRSVLKSNFTASVMAANPFQNGQKLNIATGKAGRSIYTDIDLYTPNWLVSPNTTVTGGNIVSYVLPLSLQITPYTFSQFADVAVLQHISLNSEAQNSVAAYNAGTFTITMTTQNPYDAASYSDYFALQNFLPEMRYGEWGWRDDGGGNATIYVWPFDASAGANMEIEMSVAGGDGLRCMGVGSTSLNNATNSFIEIGGLIFERQSSAGVDNDGLNSISWGNIPSSGDCRNKIYIHDCLIRDTWRSTRGYGQLWMQYVDNCTVQRITMQRTVNSFGMFFQGVPWYGNAGSPKRGQAQNLRILDCLFEDVTNSQIRLMGQTNYAVMNNWAKNGAIGDHSNQINPYVISSNGLFGGNILQDLTGYLTWGDSDPPNMFMNYIDSSHTLAASIFDSRGIVDQNNNLPNVTQGQTTIPGGNPNAPPCWFNNSPMTAFMANNQLTPNSLNSSNPSSGVVLGPSSSSQLNYEGYYAFKIANNVFTGIDFGGDTFNGSTSGSVLTINSGPVPPSGLVKVGSIITGAGIVGQPTIVSFGSGTGGVGTYNLSVSQPTLNNVSMKALYVWTNFCKSNLTTNTGINGIASVDSSNVPSSMASEYVDILSNNWKAPVNAIRRTKIGINVQSVASDIAALQSAFPDIADRLNYDAAGRLYDKNNPPVGPFVNVDDMPAYMPQFWTSPTFTGSPAAGSSYTVNNVIVASNPVGTFLYQWYKLTDYRDVTTAVAISGAINSTSPTWMIGDIGLYPAVKITTINDAGLSRIAWLISQTPIGPADPISTPIVLTTRREQAGTATSSDRETATFNSTGQPIIVAIAQYDVTASPVTFTSVTIGTPGRTAGTGTNMTLIGSTYIRSQVQFSLYFVTGVSAGNYTVQVNGSSASRYSSLIEVLGVDGATNLIAGANNGNTLSPISTGNYTPGFSNGAMLYACVRLGSDTSANPLSVAAKNVIVNEGTNLNGTSITNELAFMIAFEQAPNPVAYSASFSWPTGVRSTAVASFSIQP